MVVAFLFGAVATTIYNPLAAVMHERSKRLEAEMMGERPGSALQESTGGFWVRQRSADGAAIINAKSSREQGAQLGGVSVYTFDSAGQFQERIEAKSATLEQGYWRFEDARIYASGNPPAIQSSYRLATNLTLEQVRESFATPETVPFWQLPSYIELAERAGLVAAGYRLQYQQLLSRPFLLTAMVLLAASVSLRFFRFGGVQKMVLGGISAGFLLFVLSKFTEDMSKSELMSPMHGGMDSRCRRQSHRICRAVAPGGRLVARALRPSAVRCRVFKSGRASRSLSPCSPSARLVCWRPIQRRRKASAICCISRRGRRRRRPPPRQSDAPMLVQAAEIRYDYTNNTVSAVGNVQIYYNGSTIEADEVIYDQKTKRLQARGNVRMTEADGKITYGQLIDLTEDYRDGFVNSLRLETARRHALAAARADRVGGNYTVMQNGVYTACEPCKDDPQKPPLWQVQAARIIHDSGEKMIYFEDARVEFFGMPLAYFPFMSAPDPSVSRKSGFLFPDFTYGTAYGGGC